MRRPMVAGNWKMHGSRAEAGRLIGELISMDSGVRAADVVVCPPFVYLTEAAHHLRGSAIMLGAQDVCTEDSGAHTGEVSAVMLADVGCRFVIVGHRAVGPARAHRQRDHPPTRPRHRQRTDTVDRHQHH